MFGAEWDNGGDDEDEEADDDDEEEEDEDDEARDDDEEDIIDWVLADALLLPLEDCCCCEGGFCALNSPWLRFCCCLLKFVFWLKLFTFRSPLFALIFVLVSCGLCVN